MEKNGRDAKERAELWRLCVRRALHALASSIRPTIKRKVVPIPPLYFQPAQVAVAASHGNDPMKVSQPIGAPSYTEVKWYFEGVIFIFFDSAFKVTNEEYLQVKEEITATCRTRNLLILSLYSHPDSNEIGAIAVHPERREQAADFVKRDLRWREGDFHKFVYDLDELLSNEKRIAKAINKAFEEATIETSDKGGIMTCDDLLAAYHMRKILGLVLTNGVFEPAHINAKKYLEYASAFYNPPMRYISNEAMENPFDVGNETRMKLMRWHKV